MELTADEQKIVQKFRSLKESRKKVVKASQNAFIKWLKEDLPNLWNSVKSFISDVWNTLKELFS